MPKTSYASLIAACRKLCAAAETHEVELPSLGCFRANLEEALAEVEACKDRQANLERQRKLATRELKEYAIHCNELAMQLRSFVRACFGRKDERLAAFGFKLAARRRKDKEVEKQNGSPGFH
jgi:hypothetical protein